MKNPLMQVTTALVLAITWVIAAQQIVFAKSLPGEGFTAGALMLLAVLLIFLVQGYTQAHEQLPPRLFYRCLLMGGLTLVALLFAPVLWGEPLLSAFTIDLIVVDIESTLLFDLTLFLVTVSSLVIAVNALREGLP